MYEEQMKSIKTAIVKATGELLLVRACNDSIYKWRSDMHGQSGTLQREDQLEIIQEEDPDYWTRLEHQYAGMAMQGLVTRGEVLGSSVQEIARDIAEISCEIAHALVEKMKENEKAMH